ncbi:MAG: HEAT repeat domain-containing protein [Phycisphaerales bacterium]|nr:MAG: HEAT repeat domain-containing protein [Phycisphaerales bacterium]
MKRRPGKSSPHILVVAAACALYCFWGTLCAGAAGRSQSARQRKYLSILQSDAPLFEKARACEELAVVGDKEAVPVLAGLLGDERLGDYARFALEPIEDASVDLAFRQALGGLEGRLLAGVVNSIGVREDAEAAGALGRLARDEGSGVAGEAVAALGRIATDEAIETISGILTSGSRGLRTAAGDACLVAARRLADQAKKEQAAKLYETVGKAEVPDQIRAAAIYGEILVRGAEGIPLLIEQLGTNHPMRVEVALRAARDLPDGQVTRSLVGELKRSQPVLQVLLIQALADRGGAVAYEGIKAMAAGDSPAVRLEVIKVLGRMGDVSAVPVLVKSVAGTGREATAAAAALRTVEGDGVDKAIVEALRSAEGDTRIELIGILSDRGHSVATPVLLVHARSADAAIASAAFKALTVLAGGRDVGALAGLLANVQSEDARSYAENAVVAAALKIEDEDKRADAILAELDSAEAIAVRSSMLRVLGRIADKKAFAAVQSAAGDKNSDIQDTAVRALAAWPDSRALEALSDILESSPNNTHRVLTLRGYVRLLGLDTSLSQVDKVAMYKLAMSRARGADDQKLVLAGLANAAHPAALEIVLEYIAEPAVRNEAVLAALKVAQASAGARPREARSAAARIAEAATDPKVRSDAQRLAGTIDRFDGFIVGWQVAGPYAAENMGYAELFEVAFEPERPAAHLKWSVMPAATDAKRPWILDLLRLWPGNNRVAYVRTWIRSDKKLDVVLEAGSDDGIKAWLNGKLVHANNVARAAIPGSDKARITLNAGWNSLMLKITQNVLPWEFCARIAGADGGKVEGLEVDCLHTE